MQNHESQPNIVDEYQLRQDIEILKSPSDKSEEDRDYIANEIKNFVDETKAQYTEEVLEEVELFHLLFGSQKLRSTPPRKISKALKQEILRKTRVKATRLLAEVTIPYNWNSTPVETERTVDTEIVRKRILIDESVADDELLNSKWIEAKSLFANRMKRKFKTEDLQNVTEYHQVFNGGHIASRLIDKNI